jgi:hypothetical protein
MIRYAFLDVEPPTDARADYALGVLLEGVGVAGVRVGDARDADLVYSASRPAGVDSSALWIPAVAPRDWDAPVASVSWSGSLPFLGLPLSEESNPIPGDLLHSAYALLSGAAEDDQPRNVVGVPIGEQHALHRAGVLQQPVIALYCERLVSLLRPRREPVPRWPGGKRYAVVLSHDVDAPFLRPPWSFFARRLAGTLARGAFRASAHGLAQTVKVAASTRLARLPEPERDPNFCFDAWADLERMVGAQSAYYVAVTTSADPAGSSRDVTYDFRKPELVAQLRQAVAVGWEVGLHASINSHRGADRLRSEREQLEQVLGDGYRVSGVRHHYWAVDPDRPERTFWRHQEAGFTYDSSLGLSDVPGFRRGMAWPFDPFDRERGRPVPLLQVPPTLMDGAIFYRDVGPEEGRALIREHLERVRRAGGGAVLDWHLEQLNPMRLHGAGSALRDVLLELAGATDVYWSTPGRLADWWRDRRRQIAANV